MFEKPSLFLIFFFIFCNHFAFAKKLPMDFGNVDAEALAMTSYPADSTADAVTLVRYGFIEVNDGGSNWEGRIFQMERIKILKESGKREGDFYIRYYHSNRQERVSDLKAIVTQPDGTTYKLDKKDVFQEKINEYYSALRFSLPQVQVGSVIDIKYDFNTKNIVQLKRWYFHGDLPVAHSELHFNPHEYFAYQYFLRGYALGDSEVIKNEAFPVDVKINKTEFIIKNIPAMKEEKYLSSLNNYRSHVRFQLSSIVYPNRPMEKYLDSWEEFVNKYNTDLSRGKRFVTKMNYNQIWKDFEPLIKEEQTEKEKIKLAYDFINNYMNWDGFISTSVSKSLNALYKEKSASTAGLCFSMIALLREMDFTAYPVLSGTRRNGNLIMEAPISDQFRHTMVYVETGEDHMIIDMGEKDRPMELLNLSSLNFYGLVVKEKVSKWIPISPKLSKSLFIVNATLNDNQLTGSTQSQFTGYESLRMRDDFEEGMKTHFENTYPSGTIENVKNEDINTDSDKYKSDFDFKTEVDIIDDLIFIYPVQFSDFLENPFKLQQRFFPVEFTHPFQERTVFKFTVPEGYVVDELPKSKVSKSPNGDISYKYMAAQKDNLIDINVNLKVKKVFFRPRNYEGLKIFFDSYVESLQTPIVLRKVE